MKTIPHHSTNNLFLRFIANYIFEPISSVFLRLYLKWGTTYEVIDWETDEVLKRLGSDYDEDGIPYWEKWKDDRDGAIHPSIEKEINGKTN